MITKSFVIRPSLLVMSAGVVLIASADRCMSQDGDQKENELHQIQILLGADELDVVSPALKGEEPGQTVYVFAIPEAPQEGPDGPQNAAHPRVGVSFTGPPSDGPPGFGPKGLRMGGRAEMQQGQGPQIRHPKTHGPEGPFAEDRKRIAALTESAERIAQAGLPDVAHGLRERAGQLERELAEKQERMQQEERQRTESAMRERQTQARQIPQRLMEPRREGIEFELGNHSTPPLRELHEQMEHLRRDLHGLSEQMTGLTRLIQQHHNPGNERGHHENMDDDDGDDEDGDDEDGDDEDGDDEDGDDEDGDDEDGDDEDGDDADEMEEDDDEDQTERGEHE